MIDEWLAQYSISSNEDLLRAKREIMQKVALAGLARGGFYDHATFYGGTALRFFHGLDRFSEDLDFSLNYKDLDFSLERFLPILQREFSLIGVDVDVSIKDKREIRAVESAFLKENTIWGVISENGKTNNSFPSVKIKIEIDRFPPLDFQKESLILQKPYSFYNIVMRPSSLFAGKLSAVLFRNWRGREKGRDWYDLQWYVENQISVDLTHLKNRIKEQEDFQSALPLNKENIKNLLHERIDNLDIKSAQEDVEVFLEHPNRIRDWSADFFHGLINKLEFE